MMIDLTRDPTPTPTNGGNGGGGDRNSTGSTGRVTVVEPVEDDSVLLGVSKMLLVLKGHVSKARSR